MVTRKTTSESAPPSEPRRIVICIEEGVIEGIYADGPVRFDVLIADYTDGDRMTKDAFGKKRYLRNATVNYRSDLVAGIINKKWRR